MKQNRAELRIKIIKSKKIYTNIGMYWHFVTINWFWVCFFCPCNATQSQRSETNKRLNWFLYTFRSLISIDDRWKWYRRCGTKGEIKIKNIKLNETQEREEENNKKKIQNFCYRINLFAAGFCSIFFFLVSQTLIFSESWLSFSFHHLFLLWFNLFCFFFLHSIISIIIYLADFAQTQTRNALRRKIMKNKMKIK